MGGSADDIWGVQPMTGPTGLIFALRSQYANTTNNQVAETFYNEVNTSFSSVVSGANTLGQKHVGTVPGGSSAGYANLAANGAYNFGSGMSTAQAEALGTTGNTAFPQMGFTIDKVTVTAKSRALKAEYTMEMAQDLKAIHGLDAETELSNILTGEIMLEINRDIWGFSR
nr:major capsid protein [Myoviridae environmental samples]